MLPLMFRTMRGGRRPRRRAGIRRKIRGRGFFGDLWNGVKKVANWAKDSKIISKVGSLLPGAAGQVGRVAGQLGLGRRRRVRRVRKMRGGYLMVPKPMPRIAIFPQPHMKGGKKKSKRRQRGRGPPGGPSIDEGLGLVSVNPGPGAYWPAGDHKMAMDLARPPAPSKNIFRRAWDKFKDSRVVSRGLRAIGALRLADKAHQKGYGRRKTVRRRKAKRSTVMRGSGIRAVRFN